MKIQVRIEPTFSLKWPKVHLKFNNYTLYNGLCEPNSGKYFSFNLITPTIDKLNSIKTGNHTDKTKGNFPFSPTTTNLSALRAFATSLSKQLVIICLENSIIF